MVVIGNHLRNVAQRKTRKLIYLIQRKVIHEYITNAELPLSNESREIPGYSPVSGV